MVEIYLRVCYNKDDLNNRRQAVIAPNFVRGAQILYNIRNLSRH